MSVTKIRELNFTPKSSPNVPNVNPFSDFVPEEVKTSDPQMTNDVPMTNDLQDVPNNRSQFLLDDLLNAGSNLKPKEIPQEKPIVNRCGFLIMEN